MLLADSGVENRDKAMDALIASGDLKRLTFQKNAREADASRASHVPPTLDYPLSTPRPATTPSAAE
jgi:hypothetical protein